MDVADDVTTDDDRNPQSSHDKSKIGPCVGRLFDGSVSKGFAEAGPGARKRTRPANKTKGEQTGEC